MPSIPLRIAPRLAIAGLVLQALCSASISAADVFPSSLTPWVETILTDPPQPVASRPTSLVVLGPGRILLGGGLRCFHLEDAYVIDATRARVILREGVCDPAQPPRWDATIALGTLAPGWHVIDLELEVHEADTTWTAREPVGFTVVDDAAHPDCVVGSFDHPEGYGRCDLRLREGAGYATFQVSTPVPLAGLQGELNFTAPGYRIDDLQLLPVTTGMQLTWARTAAGARFVLFTAHGAPIRGALAQVLAVYVGRVPGQTPPPVSWLVPEGLLGSDSTGQAFPTCPVPANVRMSPDAFGLRICAFPECDWNGDGVSDVRDLVLMIRCLEDEVCQSPNGAPDCNDDHAFDVNDVLCCARGMLARPACPDCPTDTGAVRHEPTVAFTMGEPLVEGARVRVPLSLRDPGSVGAARFVLALPGGDFEVTGVHLGGDPSRWLELHELRDGRLTLGLVRLGPEAGTAMRSTNEPLALEVELVARGGRSPDGTIAMSELELSGTDGVRLEIDEPLPSRSLGGPARVALSAASPNPTRGVTRFAVTLDRAASVDLGVYDVGGRLVRALHHGALPAGETVVTWDGASARAGIYWCRAVAGEASVSRKWVVLGRP